MSTCIAKLFSLSVLILIFFILFLFSSYTCMFDLHLIFFIPLSLSASLTHTYDSNMILLLILNETIVSHGFYLSTAKGFP